MAGVFGAVATLVIAGCTALDSKPDKEALKQRAQARWNALVKGDVAEAYKYFSPTTRATLKSEDYAGSIRKGFWKDVTVNEITCESETVCDAHATVEYEYRGTRVKTPLKETWIKDGRNWWYAYK